MEDLVIDNIRIRPGQSVKLDRNIARLPSHTDIDLVIYVYRSTKPGPVLLLSGGLHGDEVNGIEIVRRLIQQEITQPLRGTVICIPVINVYGFIHFSRYVPDGKDVNRSFPGSRTGSLASRIAHYLTKHIIPHIDYGLDFHTGGADRSNFPQVRCSFKDPMAKELAGAMGIPFVLNANFLSKSLRMSAYKAKKSIVVYEGGMSSRIDETTVQMGVNGAINLMHHLGMTEETAPKTQTNWLKDSTWVRSRQSGIFQSVIENGQFVEKKQDLGNLSDPFGDFTISIKSPKSSYVIGLNHNPVVHQGDALIHLGLAE